MRTMFGRRSHASRGLRERGRARRLAIEALEQRLVMDSRSFAGLIDFHAVNSFGESGGRVSVAGPVTLRRQGETTDLLRFANGVSFLLNDPSKAFETSGQISALLPGSGDELLLLGESSQPRRFKADELFGVGGSTVETASADGTLVDVDGLEGGGLSVTGLKINRGPATAVVGLTGSFVVSADAPMQVPLPSSTRIQVTDTGAKVTGSVVPEKPTADASVQFGAMSLIVRDMTAVYESSTESSTWKFSGTANLKLPAVSDPIEVKFGDPSAPGLVITNGDLTKFDAVATTASKTFTVAGLVITPGVDPASNPLRVRYTAATEDALADTVIVNGSATFSVKGGDRSLRLDLGSSTTPDADGMVWRDGTLAKVKGRVSLDGQVRIGQVFSLTELAAQLDYDVEEDEYVIGGTGKVQLERSDRAFTVRLGDIDDDAPGLVISQGTLTTLDVAVTSEESFTYRGLTIKPKELRVAYARNTDKTGATVAFSGGAAFEFKAGGETQTIEVGLGTDDAPGFIVEAPDQGTSKLKSFSAVVTADFTVRKLKIGVDGLELSYKEDGGNTSFSLQGSVLVSATGTSGKFLDVEATLGDGEDTPGLVVENGQLKSLHLIVQGGFDLYGLSVAADGLTISYDTVAAQVVLSGGVAVKLTDKIAFGASITGGGLVIDTNTGDLSVKTGDDGLKLKGNLDLGDVFAAKIEVAYNRDTSGNFSLAASGMLDLPQGLPDVTAGFSIEAGALTGISFQLDGSFPLGSTGVVISSMGGSLRNLDDLANIEIAGNLSLSTKAKVGGVSLIDASGGFVFTPNSLRVDASVTVLNGWLGQGSGTVDLNWSTGTYQIIVNQISLFDNLISFSGSLYFDAIGNMTISAMSAINVPNSVPLIGGYQIASGNFYMQVRPQLSPDRTFAAAWISTFLGDLGVQYSWDRSFRLIFGPPEKDGVGADEGGPIYTYETSFDGLQWQRDLRTMDVTLESDWYKVEHDQGQSFQANFGGTGVDRGLVGVYLRDMNGEHITSNTPVFHLTSLERVSDTKLRATVDLDAYGVSESDRARIAKVQVLTFHKLPPSQFNQPRPQKVTLGQTYKAPTSQAPTVTDVYTGSIANRDLRKTGEVDVSATVDLTNPDQSKATASLYVTGEPFVNGQPRNGRLLKKLEQTGPLGDRFWVSDPALGTAQLQTRVRYDAFEDLVPVDASGNALSSLYFYVVLEDGYSASVVSAPTSHVRFSPHIAISAADWVPAQAGGAGNALEGYTFVQNDAKLTSLIGYDGSYSYTVSLVGGGYLSNLSDPSTDTLKRKELVSSRGDLAGNGTFHPLSGWKFVADATFTGRSVLTIKTSRGSSTEPKFVRTREVIITRPNADLETSVSLSQPKPADGDLVTATITVRNVARHNKIDALDTKTTVAMPAYLDLRDFTLSTGSFDPHTQVWNIGRLTPDATATLSLTTSFSQPVLNRSDPVSAVSRTSAVDYDPDNDRGAAQVIADRVSQLAIDVFNPPTVPLNFDGTTDVPLARLLVDPDKPGAGGPYTFEIVSGKLPPGVTLERDGTLKGVPARADIYAFTVRVHDRLGNTSQRAVNWVVRDAEFRATVDTSFFARSRFGLSDGSFSRYLVKPGDPPLPPGLRVETTFTLPPYTTYFGEVRGTPTTPGTYRFRLTKEVTLPDRVVEYSKWFVMEVAAATATTRTDITLTNPSLGVAYDQPITVPGLSGTGTLRFYLDRNSRLPDGLSLSPAGRITGVPTSTASISPPIIHVYANTGTLNGQPHSAAVATVRIGSSWGTTSATATVVPSLTLPAASRGERYSHQIVAFARSGNPVFSSSQLPVGLSLTASGLLSGTPTATSSGTVVIAVRDGTAGTSQNHSFSLRVGEPLTVARRVLPDAVHLRPYSARIVAQGGSGTGFAFELFRGTLPGGLTLDRTTGTISGVPNALGGDADGFQVRITDSLGGSTIQVINIGTSSLSIGNLGDAYSARTTSDTGTNFRVVSGALPDGLTLTSTGALSGNPTKPGIFDFVVSYGMVGGNGVASTKFQPHRVRITPEITLRPARPFVSPGPGSANQQVPVATVLVHSQFTARLPYAGGYGSGYHARVSSGDLPAGLTLSADGGIAGRPTSTGVYNFVIEVTDEMGGKGSGAYRIVVVDPVRIDANRTTIPAALVAGSAAQGLLQATGTGVTYTLVKGPDGLRVDPKTGALRGSPKVPGTYQFFAYASDRFGQVASFAPQGAPLFLSVAPRIRIGPASLPIQQESAGPSFSVPLTASGGRGGPFTFSLDPSTPTSLSVTSGGELRGDRVAAGTYRILVTATDSGGFKATRPFDLTVNAQPRTNNAVGTTLTGNPATLNLLSFASDPEGQDISIDPDVSPTANGKTQVVGDRLIYTPNAGFVGTDYVDYRVRDSAGGVINARAEITVRSTNGVLTATDDQFQANFETPTTIDVLANDTDADGDAMSLLGLDTTGTRGRVALQAGKVLYVPPPGFTGTDSFQYTMTDGNRTATATVRVETQRVSHVSLVTSVEAVVAEDLGVVRLDVARTGELSTNLTLNYTLLPIGDLVLDRDIRPGPRTVTFAAGRSLASIEVGIVNNTTFNPARSMQFFVQLEPRAWVDFANGVPKRSVRIMDDETNTPTPVPTTVFLTAVRAVRPSSTAPVSRIALDFNGPTRTFSSTSRPAALELRRAGRDRRFGTADDLIVAFSVVTRTTQDGGNANTRVVRISGPNARLARGETLQVRHLSGLRATNSTVVRTTNNRFLTIRA